MGQLAQEPDAAANNVDFGLQIGVEEILVDVDPDISLEFLQQAEALAGKPPPSRVPREDLVATHNKHVDTQRKSDQQNTPRMVKKVVLALSYPPSVRPVKDLTPMRIDELLVENHHEEQCLIVRTITPPYKGAGTVAIVEDQYGNAAKMALYNQGDSSVLYSIPEGSVVAIKEPYYRFSGEDDYMISVDHPSDILLLRHGPDDTLIPAVFRSEHVSSDAGVWRDAGDKAFVAKDLPLAIFNYTRALELAPPDDDAFRSGVFAKRATINLSVSRYDFALEDALSSRGGSTDWRAYFVAAKAAYQLCDFQASRQYFESALEKTSTTHAIKREYDRCLARLDEEARGNFDFNLISRTVKPKDIHLDKASFLRKTIIQDSPHHGRGLFATCDIKAGELIFAEKATSVPNEFNPEHNSAAAYAQLVEYCTDNPSMHKKVLDLYGGSYKRSGLEGSVVDGKPIVDVFLLESIRRKNCFSGAHVSAQAATPDWDMLREGMSRGLWVYSAYANHACLPNSNRSFVGDMLISTATVDIPKGTEITHIYLPPKAVFLRRVAQFRRSWGFNCSCLLCTGETASPLAAHEKRIEVLGEIEVIVKKKNPKVFQPDALIRNIEKMARKLQSLHESEVYDNLPRLMMVWPSMWLVEVWHTRKKWAKTAQWGAEVFRNFGFIDPMRNGSLYMYEDTRAITTFELVKALKLTAEAHANLGDERLAKQCLTAAKMGLKIMVGFVTDESFAAFK